MIELINLRGVSGLNFERVPYNELRSHKFNLKPDVSSGPFKFSQIVQEQEVNQVELDRNDGFYDYRQKPMLEQFIVRIFDSNDSLKEAFLKKEITAAVDIKEVDPEIENDENFNVLHIKLNSGVYAFLHNQDPILKNKDIRHALNLATDKNEIFKAFDSRQALIDGPLLDSQEGYLPEKNKVTIDLKKANSLLDKNGWKLDESGIRQKKGKKLSFKLVAQNDSDYSKTAELLQKQWRKVGVELETTLVEPQDIQQNHVSSHNYQILLMGITLGSDPDVFAYWHSSQAGVRGYNLSEYVSDIADSALEAGRTRTDQKIRNAKYKTFQDQWRKDLPAISLYRPVFIYALRKPATGPSNQALSHPEQRYANVSSWSVNQQTINRKK